MTDDPDIIEAAEQALIENSVPFASMRDIARAVLAAVTPLILEQAAKVADEFPTEVVQFYARGPNDPPGNLTRWSKPSNIAAAIRALKEQP